MSIPRALISVALGGAVSLGPSCLGGDALFEIDVLTADDADPFDGFGRSVAIEGSTIVVGASGDDGAQLNAGALYLFDVADLQAQRKVYAATPFAGDNLGRSAAIDGGVVAAGGRNVAFIFDAASGDELHRLVPWLALPSPNFGFSIDLDDGVVVVGAPTDTGEGVGAAWVFDAVTGAPIVMLAPSDGEVNDRFGCAVAIEGTTVAVGAYGDDDNGDWAGAVYLFDLVTRRETKVAPREADAQERFGLDVALAGDRLVVRGRQGSAYLFDSMTGSEIDTLVHSLGEPDFAGAVAIDDDAQGFVVGTVKSSDGGRVRLYDVPSTRFLEEVETSDDPADESFGSALALGSEHLVVGAASSFDLTYGGSVYLYGRGCANPADLDGSGVVDFGDLLAILVVWGPCDGACPEDLDGSGAVDLGDLLTVLSEWGACAGR